MAINIPQPSLRKACHSQRAFTMTELIIVVGIIGVLLAVGVPRYSQQVREYRLQAITARLATWLDEQRRLAIQQAGPCAISINTSTATFDASVNDTGITNDVCGSTASQPRDSVLRLRNLENGTNNLTLTLLGTTNQPAVVWLSRPQPQWHGSADQPGGQQPLRSGHTPAGADPHGPGQKRILKL